MGARHNDPESSHNAALKFRKHAGKVDDLILQVVRSSGSHGSTQSEVVSSITDYKPGSITPRFVKLVARGKLIRIPVGKKKPTKKFPEGHVWYITRRDAETNCDVTVYWVPEFAPSSPKVDHAQERRSAA